MSTEQKRARLLPCPFCGGPGERQSGGEGESRRYGCSCPNWKCVGHSSMLRHTNQRDAVDEWNRRAALQSQDREDDPLQPAANWLIQAVESCTVADIQRGLNIGHNRAKRLFDHARRVEGGGE